jgi:hypothetical protein
MIFRSGVQAFFSHVLAIYFDGSFHHSIDDVQFSNIFIMSVALSKM